MVAESTQNGVTRLAAQNAVARPQPESTQNAGTRLQTQNAVATEVTQNAVTRLETQNAVTLTVTMSHKRKPTTPLELLEDALEKQGLLVHKKDDFLSRGPQLKDHVIGVIPTAPFDSDMKVADRDMYAPLLAHYPTRGFFLRLSKLLAFGMWMRTECVERWWVISNGELETLDETRDPGLSRDLETRDRKGQSRDLSPDPSPSRDLSPDPNLSPDSLHIRYVSSGSCEYFPERLERLTNHAWKLFEFEYDGQRPDAVCVYVQSHDTWMEQVVMGYDGGSVGRMNCSVT